MTDHEQLKINIVVDNDSWILSYAYRLVDWCLTNGHHPKFCKSYEDVDSADISFFLGCIHIAPKTTLEKATCNLVVHESNLPEGRGFAPMSWQILEGKKRIPIVLLEAAEGDVDSGKIFLKSEISLEGHELSSEWRKLQGEETISLCQKFIDNYPNVSAVDQEGVPSFFNRRTPDDSKLDISKSIKDQFDLLRVVDNQKYPAFFDHLGTRYKLTIQKETPLENENTYIFASIKPWQIDYFNNLSNQLPGRWTLISDHEQLTEEFVKKNKPRYIFFGHWSMKVSEEILSHAECVCFHMTDVPFGRGGSPLQNLIARGIKETKLTALKMVTALDAGPVYDKKPLNLEGSAQDIFERMTPLIFDMMTDIVAHEPQPYPQHGEVTYFDRRTPDMSVVPKNADLEKIYDHIRMLDAETYPAAFIEYGEIKILFKNAMPPRDNKLKVEVEIMMNNREDQDD